MSETTKCSRNCYCTDTQNFIWGTKSDGTQCLKKKAGIVTKLLGIVTVHTKVNLGYQVRRNTMSETKKKQKLLLHGSQVLAIVPKKDPKGTFQAYTRTFSLLYGRHFYATFWLSKLKWKWWSNSILVACISINWWLWEHMIYNQKWYGFPWLQHGGCIVCFKQSHRDSWHCGKNATRSQNTVTRRSNLRKINFQGLKKP